MPGNLQIGIKNNKRELRQSTKILKLILTNNRNHSPNSPKHAKRMKCQGMKCQKGKDDDYCKLILKLKSIYPIKHWQIPFQSKLKNLFALLNIMLIAIRFGVTKDS